jgi:hypothetical protein
MLFISLAPTTSLESHYWFHNYFRRHINHARRTIQNKRVRREFLHNRDAHSRGRGRIITVATTGLIAFATALTSALIFTTALAATATTSIATAVAIAATAITAAATAVNLSRAAANTRAAHCASDLGRHGAAQLSSDALRLATPAGLARNARRTQARPLDLVGISDACTARR